MSPAGICCAQGRPGRGDVARPGGGGVALLPGEGRAREDEHALVGRRRALALVDALAVEERVGVEHPRAAAHRGRVHVRALRVEVGGRQEVRLGRVHPPRVHAAAEEVALDLRPEELPRLGVEGVVEGVGVAGAHPVPEAGAQVRLVEEARAIASKFSLPG